MAPEISIGFPTQDELEDMATPRATVPVVDVSAPADLLPPAKPQENATIAPESREEAAPANDTIRTRARAKTAPAAAKTASGENEPPAPDAETALAQTLAAHGCNRTVQDIKDFFVRIGQAWDAATALANLNQVLADMVKEEQAMAGAL